MTELSEFERPITRGGFLRSAGGVAAALALGGGPLAANALATRKAGELTLWVITPFTAHSNPPLQKGIQKYQSETGVKVNVESFTNTSLQNTLITAVKGGQGPDVVSIDGGWVPTLAAAGVLTDLTSEFRQIKSQFFAGPIASGGFGGKQWAVPWYTNNVGLYWNKKMFKAAGIAKPPTTWAELAATAQKLTKNGKYGLDFGGSGYGSFLWLPFAWQNGTNFFSPDGKQALFGSAAGQAAWTYYADLARKVAPPTAAGATTSWDQYNAPFIQEQVAMMTTGDWGLAPVISANPDLDFGVVPLPKGKFHATVAGGYNLAIPKNANQTEAWKLIKWMSAPQQQWILQGYFRLPAIKAALKAHYDPRRKAFLQQADFAKVQPRVAQWSGILYGPLADAWESVLLGKGTPAQALKDAADKASSMLH